MARTRTLRGQTRAALLSASLGIVASVGASRQAHAEPLTQEELLSTLAPPPPTASTSEREDPPAPPAPPGKARQWKKRKVLAIVGGSALGAGYLFSAIFAGIMSLGQSFCGLGDGPCDGAREYGYNLVPLVGPFVTMHTARDAFRGKEGGMAGLAVMGLLQNAGLFMLISGQYLRKDMPETSLAVSPMFSAKGAGVAISGSF